LFSTGEDFPARVAEYAQSIRDTRPLDPARPVRVPFDRSITERNERLALDAIDVPDKVVQALRDIIAQGRNSA
jgi:LDH2 family malate/lactate/ureidoglycolate dehydrogenase